MAKRRCRRGRAGNSLLASAESRSRPAVSQQRLRRQYRFRAPRAVSGCRTSAPAYASSRRSRLRAPPQRRPAPPEFWFLVLGVSFPAYRDVLWKLGQRGEGKKSVTGWKKEAAGLGQEGEFKLPARCLSRLHSEEPKTQNRIRLRSVGWS